MIPLVERKSLRRENIFAIAFGGRSAKKETFCFSSVSWDLCKLY